MGFKHSIRTIKGDIWGGITAGIVALPLALAFGVASRFGPVAGLYGAIAVGFFAALFGGTPTQVSGPTGPMSIIFAAAIVGFPEDVSAVIGVKFLAGIFQIILGYFKVGIFVRYIPYPVISGFMSGIGVILTYFLDATLNRCSKVMFKMQMSPSSVNFSFNEITLQWQPHLPNCE